MHKLLQRQVAKHFAGAIPPELTAFLAAIDEAYRASDDDRLLHERSLELTSQELMERNRSLRSEGDEIRKIVSAVPYGLAICRNGRYLFTSAQWASYLEYAPENLSGVAFLDLVDAEDHPLVARRMREAEATGTNGTDEIRCRTKSGGTVLLELSRAQRIQFEGSAAYLLGARDVSDRKLDEQQMLLAGRMAAMGTLTAGIAHEINNPLSYVVANLTFLAKLFSTPAGVAHDFEESQEALRDARDGAERVRCIVRDLKAFSRPDDEKHGPISLRKVAQAAAKLTANEIRPRARLVLDLGENLLAFGNEAKLGQVLVNLLVNAAQAIEEGDTETNVITIRTGDADPRVFIEVADSGGGIPEDVRAKIFDPFFTTKPIGVGTGLGLSICHGIIVAMQGEIEVRSEVGKGTTFRVTLPGLEGDPETTPVTDVEVSTRRGRVLLIDDEPLIGTALKRILEGHEVTSTTRAADALDLLKRGCEFDVILCDLMMPGLSGMDFFESLSSAMRARTAFITGGAFTPRTRAFLDESPNARLQKPLVAEQLRGLVAVILKTGSALGSATR